MYPLSNKISDIKKFIKENLITNYDINEIQYITKILLLKITGLTYEKLLSINDFVFNESDIVWINNALKKLINHCPIQYISGYEYFLDLKIEVNSNVLIPRPETEELVKIIIENHKNSTSDINVIDLGTGSGCIAIALKKNKPNWNINAIDISYEAIELAKKNAYNNHVEIDFKINNILNYSFSNCNFYDIIVSNPPYICNKEKKVVRSNVIDFEPHTALFVEDEIPLIFYDKISDIANKILKINGCLYFEINELYGYEIKKILNSKDYKNIEIIKDFFGKDRFIRCMK